MHNLQGAVHHNRLELQSAKQSNALNNQNRIGHLNSLVLIIALIGLTLLLGVIVTKRQPVKSIPITTKLKHFPNIYHAYVQMDALYYAQEQKHTNRIP